MRPNPNFYHQDFQEQQRLQAYHNNRRYNQPLNDGFSISDGSQGTVVAVDGQSRADYDKMIKSNFKYTQDNYQEAYKEAARTGKPVVAIFGGFENNNSRQLIENSLPNAKSGAAKDAVYVYIDRAKTKDGELAQFADGQLAGGHNAAISIVFSVKPGQDGSLQPEAANFRWQGADHSMISSFNQAISAAKEKQESYTGKFNPAALVDKTEKTEKTERGDQPGGSFESARGLITKEITMASQAKDWHDAERHYHEAIDAADKFTPQQIQSEQQRIAKALATTPQDSPAFQQLAKDQANLTFVKNAKSSARADLGIACLEWSESQNDPERKQKFREIGSQWIQSAALRNPGLYENPEFQKRIAATNIPVDELQKLLPKLATNANPDLFQFGGDGKKLDLFRFGGDGKKYDAPPSTVTPETKPKGTKGSGGQSRGFGPADTEPETQTQYEPPKPFEQAKPILQPQPDVAKRGEEGKEREAKEAKDKEAERIKKIVEEDEEKAVKTPEQYYAALRDAAEKGLPVVVKIGSKTCGPCKAMAPALKQAEEDLKGKAVVIRVLYENTEDLAVKLGADEGVPITKFAKVVPNGTAQPDLVDVIEQKRGGFKNDKPENKLDSFIASGFEELKKRRATKK